MTSLEEWGWDARWEEAFRAAPGRGLHLARVISEHRGAYDVVCPDGERVARLPGAMRHKAVSPADLPAVGDWLAIETAPRERAAVVRRVLPRRTKLSRRAAGENDVEQVIAANLDVVFIVTALNQDFNARRLERFLSVCRESGAESVLLLNKLDLCADAGPYLDETRAVAGGAPVVCASAKTGDRLDEIAPWLKPGRTVGFVGSSGVGKSTLVNRLLGADVLRTREIRAHDDRGRHTTTRRELFRLPGGAILLDTPGMREMQSWAAERGTAETFEEIDALAALCRFKDCGHGTEPGCAVKTGLDSGAVTPQRLESWRKLRKELDDMAKRERRKNWKNPPKAGR